MTEKWMAEKYILLNDNEAFLMKTSPHISAIHFSVIAFEWFSQHMAYFSEKLAALGFLAGRSLRYVFNQ
jgi:hypothetical protein